MKERRRAKRYLLNRLAKIQPQVGALPRDCLVVDLSDAGVRLHTEAADVPDEFTLLIASAAGKDEHRACRVVWRLGREIGAHFTDRSYSFTWRVLSASVGEPVGELAGA